MLDEIEWFRCVECTSKSRSLLSVGFSNNAFTASQNSVTFWYMGKSSILFAIVTHERTSRATTPECRTAQARPSRSELQNPTRSPVGVFWRNSGFVLIEDSGWIEDSVRSDLVVGMLDSRLNAGTVIRDEQLRDQRSAISDQRLVIHTSPILEADPARINSQLLQNQRNLGHHRGRTTHKTTSTRDLRRVAPAAAPGCGRSAAPARGHFPRGGQRQAYVAASSHAAQFRR